MSTKYSNVCYQITILILILIILLMGRSSFHGSIIFSQHITSNSTQIDLSSNTTKNSSIPVLCIIIRMYWAQMTYLPVLALGLHQNGLNNIRIYVVNTDNQTDVQQLKQIVYWINNLVRQNDFVTLLDFGQPATKNDFGYEMTDRALKYLYEHRLNSSSICHYLTVTNGDNFYGKNFVKRLLPHMNEGKDIIGWGFVSHHYKVHFLEKIDKNLVTVPKVVDEGTEKCTPVGLAAGHADLGAVAYRLAFIYMHQLYFRAPDGSYGFGSDGYFVTTAASKTNSSVVLRQTLFFHQ